MLVLFQGIVSLHDCARALNFAYYKKCEVYYFTARALEDAMEVRMRILRADKMAWKMWKRRFEWFPSGYDVGRGRTLQPNTREPHNRGDSLVFPCKHGNLRVMTASPES